MNLNEIIEKSHSAQSKYMESNLDAKEIVAEIKNYLENNFELLKRTYEIDSKEELSLKKLLNQLDIDAKVKSEPFINDFGKGANMDVPYGVFGVVTDSDIYKVLRIIILGLTTKNAMIINITRNIGINFLIIKAIDQILNKYKIEKFIQIYSNNAGDILEESEKIDGIIYVGKKVDVERLRVSSTIPIIYSGCGNYEIYIEDILDENIVNEIIKKDNLRIYSKKGIGIGQEVSGLDEAIARIHEYGSGYSAGIITESRESAEKFISKVKTRNVFVNASPLLIDDELDIEAKDLIYRKSILLCK